ncbi:hypothetical protein ABG768_020570 [Culter alburnus]|uniref:Uncharacterized protein n=1 Tax=Culter alburnus TaxID=194366 RepID=A0AAW2B1D1_CULAL
MSITCHYVTPQYDMKSRVLTTTSFPNEAKTADNIRKKELPQQLVSVLGFDALVMNCVVWVTDQGANYVAALRPYRHLDCQDHLYNTVLRHALNTDELSETVPEVAETLQATKALLQEILQSSESQRLQDVSPDVLAFLVRFLRPFYDAQRELEGDKYPTLNLVVPWLHKLKHHCQPDVLDTPSQTIIRQRHLEWILKKIHIQPLHKLAIFLWPKFIIYKLFVNYEQIIYKTWLYVHK